MGGHIEEHHRIWLGVTLNKQWTHFSWHAYSCKKVYVGETSLFCRSLGPHIKALVEHADWSCTRQMHPVTFFDAWIVPMLCEFPQYISWSLTAQPTWWLEVQLCPADLHIGKAFPVSYALFSFSVTVVIMFHLHLIFVFCYSFLLVSLHNVALNFVLT